MANKRFELAKGLVNRKEKYRHGYKKVFKLQDGETEYHKTYKLEGRVDTLHSLYDKSSKHDKSSKFIGDIEFLDIREQDKIMSGYKKDSESYYWDRACANSYRGLNRDAINSVRSEMVDYKKDQLERFGVEYDVQTDTFNIRDETALKNIFNNVVQDVYERVCADMLDIDINVNVSELSKEVKDVVNERLSSSVYGISGGVKDSFIDTIVWSEDRSEVDKKFTSSLKSYLPEKDGLEKELITSKIESLVYNAGNKLAQYHAEFLKTLNGFSYKGRKGNISEMMNDLNKINDFKPLETSLFEQYSEKPLIASSQ